MGVFRRIFGKTSPPQAPADGAEHLKRALLLIPALIRIGWTAKDPEDQVGALVDVAGETEAFAEVTPAIVYAMISAATRSMMFQGTGAVLDGVRAGLDSGERLAALHIAIKSAVRSEEFDEGDLDLLAGIAGALGVPGDEFGALCAGVRAPKTLH